MPKKRSFYFVLLCFLIWPVVGQCQIEVRNVRVANYSAYTRVVFDLSASIKHSLFTLSAPERVVLDLQNADLKMPLSTAALKDLGLLQGMRSAVRDRKNLRIVLDVSQRVRPRSFILPPEQDQGYRLVVDLYDARLNPSAKVTKTIPKATALRDIVVAIDAGHGGKDPGALGHLGLNEKDVTLSLAKKLAREIDRHKGMKAVLIREGDYFIPLRKRIVKARNHKADLLLSIHADAFINAKASGSSVYVLSLNGASSEAAKWLADRENAADLIGGISLYDKDDLLASVLLDLSQTATIQSSLEVGAAILDQLERVNKIHKNAVQQAGFLVLKSPDIPSVLIETAFITNPAEAEKLRNSKHQEKLARAIVRGVRRYFAKKAPPGTWLAQNQN